MWVGKKKKKGRAILGPIHPSAAAMVISKMWMEKKKKKPEGKAGKGGGVAFLMSLTGILADGEGRGNAEESESADRPDREPSRFAAARKRKRGEIIKKREEEEKGLRPCLAGSCHLVALSREEGEKKKEEKNQEEGGGNPTSTFPDGGGRAQKKNHREKGNGPHGLLNFKPESVREKKTGQPKEKREKKKGNGLLSRPTSNQPLMA